ncbi:MULTISPECIES: hypothetical protein [Streptomycetaceae]|uniref:hypothetical protein n=1 Tax=Streptomycetaceae TaxID=2062 RepID=UPI0018E93346|nr:hypothetical protein [Streptomyces sp. CB02056]
MDGDLCGVPVHHYVDRGADRYAQTSTASFWRIEQSANGVPLLHPYVLDPASCSYCDADVFTGTIKTTAPFAVEIGLSMI